MEDEEQESRTAADTIKENERVVLDLSKENTILSYEQKSIVDTFGTFEDFELANRNLYASYLKSLGGKQAGVSADEHNQMISTAADRVRSLSNSIAQGLEVGQRYVALLNQLTSTKDPKELLAATENWKGSAWENAFVKFPQHYQLADYYLLLMARMLELNNESGLTIEENDIHHQLLAKISPMEDQERFTFEIDPRNGGAFAEQHHHEPLFYLNLKHQILKFSNRALVDFFISVRRRNSVIWICKPWCSR